MEKTGVKVKETNGYIVFKWFNTIIMLIVCAVTLYPFLYLVAQSFSSEEAITLGKVNLLPIGFNVETYKSVLVKGEFMHAYKNTLVYSVLGTILSLVFSCCMAYPLSKKELKGYKVLTKFVIFTMYFGGGLIPNYVLMMKLHLINRIAGFIIPSLLSTYYIILMKSFFAETPHELEEASQNHFIDPPAVTDRMEMSAFVIVFVDRFYGHRNHRNPRP